MTKKAKAEAAVQAVDVEIENQADRIAARVIHDIIKIDKP
jgi:hypothetical protein